MKTALMIIVSAVCAAVAFLGGELDGRRSMKHAVAQMESKCAEMNVKCNEAEAALSREFGTPANAHDARCRAAAITLERYAYATGLLKSLIEDTVILDWSVHSNEPECVVRLAKQRLEVIEAYIRDLAMPKDKDVAKAYQMTLKACMAVQEKAQSIIEYRKRYPGMYLRKDLGFDDKRFYGFEGPCQDATMWIEGLQRKKLPELKEATLWIYMVKHHPEEFTR